MHAATGESIRRVGIRFGTISGRQKRPVSRPLSAMNRDSCTAANGSVNSITSLARAYVDLPHSALMFAALMIAHHFSISAL